MMSKVIGYLSTHGYLYCCKGRCRMDYDIVRYGDCMARSCTVVWQGEAEADNGDGAATVPAILAVDERGHDLAAVQIDGRWVDAMGLRSTRDWWDLPASLVARVDVAIQGLGLHKAERTV